MGTTEDPSFVEPWDTTALLFCGRGIWLEGGREPPTTTTVTIHGGNPGLGESHVLRGIEERESPEADIRSENLKALLDSIPLGLVVVIGPDGRVAYANRRCRELCGLTTDMGIPPDDRDKNLCFFDLDGRRLTPDELPIGRALQRGEIVRGMRMIIEKPDGHRVIVSVRCRTDL